MITEEQYITTQHQLQFVASMIADWPLEAMLEEIGRTETIAPFLDPTLYIAGRDKLEDVKALVRAALPLKREAQRQIDEQRRAAEAGRSA